MILFDVGGTLVNAPDIFEALGNQFKSTDKQEIVCALKEKFSALQTNAHNFLTVVELISASCDAIASKWGALSCNPAEIYRNIFVENATLFEETRYVLTELKRNGVLLVAVSDADSEVLLEELRLLGIHEYFEGFIISSDVKAYKPTDPFVKRVSEICTVPLSEIFLVGDLAIDIQTAKKLGVKSVLIVRDGIIKEHVVKEHADYIVSNLRELLNIVQSSEKVHSADTV